MAHPAQEARERLEVCFRKQYEADRGAEKQRAERELQDVRSAIRTLREAAESAHDQGLTFELERAEEREVQLLDALAQLDANPD